MAKSKKQVGKVSECNECREQNKIVDDVIKTVEENKGKEPRKKTLFELFESLSQLNHSVINVKIEITWPKDM